MQVSALNHTNVVNRPFEWAENVSLEAPPEQPQMSPELRNYYRNAADDVQSLRTTTARPLPIPQQVIPNGDSTWKSKPDSMFSFLCDEWTWSVTRTDDQLRMFCPGCDRQGNNQDKQIVLQNNPDGSTTLKIQFDGQWLPDVKGRVEQTRNGMVFVGENGMRIEMRNTRDGFDLSFDGMEKLPGKLPKLNGETIKFRRG
ncbi:MAG: hypothetical protein AB7S38_19815 [Vulcanimicrobiota bacterium]